MTVFLHIHEKQTSLSSITQLLIVKIRFTFYTK